MNLRDLPMPRQIPFYDMLWLQCAQHAQSSGTLYNGITGVSPADLRQVKIGRAYFLRNMAHG